MSKKHAKKFIERLHKDKTLRKKVNLSTEHILKVAAEDHGYVFTQEELRSALKEHWGGSDDRYFLLFGVGSHGTDEPPPSPTFGGVGTHGTDEPPLPRPKPKGKI